MPGATGGCEGSAVGVKAGCAAGMFAGLVGGGVQRWSRFSWRGAQVSGNRGETRLRAARQGWARYPALRRFGTPSVVAAGGGLARKGLARRRGWLGTGAGREGAGPDAPLRPRDGSALSAPARAGAALRASRMLAGSSAGGLAGGGMLSRGQVSVRVTVPARSRWRLANPTRCGRRQLKVHEPRRRRLALTVDVVRRGRVTVGQPFQPLPEVGPRSRLGLKRGLIGAPRGLVGVTAASQPRTAASWLPAPLACGSACAGLLAPGSRPGRPWRRLPSAADRGGGADVDRLRVDRHPAQHAACMVLHRQRGRIRRQGRIRRGQYPTRPAPRQATSRSVSRHRARGAIRGWAGVDSVTRALRRRNRVKDAARTWLPCRSRVGRPGDRQSRPGGNARNPACRRRIRSCVPGRERAAAP